jgi:RNA polymerase sigma-70 factor (ECF subfamily)
MLGDRDDADDALQSAFVRAYRGLDGCRDPDRFGAWLRRIVVNQCRTFAMNRSRREHRIVRDEAVVARFEAPQEGSRSTTLEGIERAVARLNPEHREAFLLKHVEEHSYEEMAEITGVGISALKMRVKRACEQLREQLEGVRDG